MKSDLLSRIGGIFLLGVFALNVYIGEYDTNLRTLQPLHWDVNWVFATANLIAAALLLGFPRKLPLVVLAGIVWPVLYVGSLGVDVYTRLCIGGSQANCWPSRSAAFQYLILNNPNISGGYGWHLWQGTVPTVLALSFLTFVLSAVSAYMLQKSRHAKAASASVTSPGMGSTAGTSP